jgi:hypothetical protein
MPVCATEEVIDFFRIAYALKQLTEASLSSNRD